MWVRNDTISMSISTIGLLQLPISGQTMAKTTRNRRFGLKNIGESHTVSSGIGVLFEASAIDFRSSRNRDVMFYQSKLLYHGRPERAWRGKSININGENDRSVPVVLVFCNFVFHLFLRWALLCDTIVRVQVIGGVPRRAEKTIYIYI